ncbi:MAG: ribonuclease D [Nannocystaceae bacterium]|nr:HRDC domain-containing protein [bacterium]
MEAIWVDTDDALLTWCERLADQPRIAVDTEANSMFAYHEQICLVQVSTPEVDLLVDPLAVDLAPLGRVLEDASVQKVMHGADYDVLIFKRRQNVGISNLFDTMLAARVLGWPKCGLASLLDEHFGFKANKAFQRYDWGQRPLSDAAFDYARFDTHYLLALCDIQSEALDAGPHRELFDRACVRQTAVVPRERPFDPDGYWKMKGARDLDEPGRAVLKALYAWREKKAAALDRPPFRVLPELAMISVARSRPGSRGGLAVLKGMPKPVARRDGPELLALIADAAATPCPQPKRPPVDKARVERIDKLKAWRKAEASRLGVDPEIVLDRASLMAVADGGIEALPTWERDRYGDALAASLA